MHEIARGRWTIPAISGFLIVLALVTERLFGTVGFADLAMVAAAVVAGTPIAIKAVNALIAKVVGIDLLVAVAAIGAVIIAASEAKRVIVESTGAALVSHGDEVADRIAKIAPDGVDLIAILSADRHCVHSPTLSLIRPESSRQPTRPPRSILVAAT